MAPFVNSSSTRVRLDYLDGIRAVAALYVSMFHATLVAIWSVADPFANASQWTLWTVAALQFGHFFVSIFIVLSGYCLMLPVARRNDGQLPGGIIAFLGRRARRLLPTYYAALVFCLLVTALLPGLRDPVKTIWSSAMPMWNSGVLLSHLFLVQNWNGNWLFKIDPPAWSLAPEAQIYVIFAVVLLPLCRRVGVAGTAVLAGWMGLEIHGFRGGVYDDIYWGYVGLFAMGMLGASINFSPAAWAKLCRERLPWGIFAVFAWLVVIRMTVSPGRLWMYANVVLANQPIGVATTCLLVFCTQALSAPSAGHPPLIVRMFRARWLVLMGGFSYSFYLVHDPILCMFELTLRPFKLGFSAREWWMLGSGIPIAVLVSYWFHRAFERPFMPGQPTTAIQAAQVAVVSPAP